MNGIEVQPSPGRGPTAFCLQEPCSPTISGFQEDHLSNHETTHTKASLHLLTPLLIKNVYLFTSLGLGAHVLWFGCGNQRTTSGTGLSLHRVGPMD